MPMQEVKHQCLDLACRGDIVTADSRRNPEATSFDVTAHDSVPLAYVHLKMKRRTLLNDCFYVAIHVSVRAAA